MSKNQVFCDAYNAANGKDGKEDLKREILFQLRYGLLEANTALVYRLFDLFKVIYGSEDKEKLSGVKNMVWAKIERAYNEAGFLVEDTVEVAKTKEEICGGILNLLLMGPEDGTAYTVAQRIKDNVNVIFLVSGGKKHFDFDNTEVSLVQEQITDICYTSVRNIINTIDTIVDSSNI